MVRGEGEWRAGHPWFCPCGKPLWGGYRGLLPEIVPASPHFFLWWEFPTMQRRARETPESGAGCLGLGRCPRPDWRSPSDMNPGAGVTRGASEAQQSQERSLFLPRSCPQNSMGAIWGDWEEAESWVPGWYFFLFVSEVFVPSERWEGWGEWSGDERQQLSRKRSRRGGRREGRRVHKAKLDRRAYLGKKKLAGKTEIKVKWKNTCGKLRQRKSKPQF